MNGSSIFKKVFPVVLVIAMICLVTLVTTCAKTGKTNKPEISNPNGEYISIKETINGKEYKYVISRSEMYEELKSGIGLSTLITEANKKVLAEEMKSVSEEDIEKEIKKATYGEDVDPEDLTEEDRNKKKKEFEESMLQGYGYENEDEIKDHYRLVLAKKAYANKKLYEEAKDAKDGDDLYIADTKIDDYYKDNYNKSYYAIIVPFASSESIKSALLQLGVVRSGDKWYHAELKEIKVGSGIYEVDRKEELTVNEIIETILKLNEMVYGYQKDYGYKVENAIFDSEKKTYTVPEGCDYAVVSCADKLAELKALATELTPLVTPADGSKLTDEEKQAALAKVTEIQAKLDEISAMLVYTTEVKKIQNIITSLTDSLNYETKEDDKNETPEDPTIVTQTLNKFISEFDGVAYIFNTNNEESKFFYSYSDLKAYDSNLPSEFKNNYIEYIPYGEGDKSASKNGEKWFSASYVSSGNMYYIILKIKEKDAEQLADVKEEIKNKLLEEKLTSSYIEKKMAELRNDKGFKVYDTDLEKEYINTISSYKIKYKQSKKDGSNVVGEIDGTKFTSDDLFKAMDKTSGAASVVSELSYRRMVNNALFNKYYDYTTGKWIGKEGKDKRDEITTSIENQRLYYLSGAYSSYGYDPSSMSWSEFLKNVNGAKDEKDLAFLNLYSQVISDYIKKAFNTITVTGEGKDTKFEDTYAEALTSKVWKLIEERMKKAQEEEFTVNGVHLLVSAYKTVNDAVASKNSSSSSSSSSSSKVSALDPKDWTEEQVKLAKELIEKVSLYLESAEGTYESKLEAVVSAFDSAPYAYVDPTTNEYVKIINDSGEEYKYYLECAECKIDLAKYKSAGLTLTYQNLGSFTNGKMVKEFEEAARSIWKKDYADKEFNRVTVYGEPIKTEFGYHLYVNLSSSDYTEYDSIKVDANGNPVYTNDVLEKFKSVLPSLYEVRLGLLLTALEAIDQTKLSKEDAKVVQEKIDELKPLYTTEIKTAVEKYATPIVTNLNSSYYSSLVQQAEVLSLMEGVTIDSPSGINLAKIKKLMDISRASIFKSNLANLEEGDQDIVKASDVYGK